MTLAWLLACTGNTADPLTVRVADYVLNLVPVVPTNQSPFSRVDRLELVLDDGQGNAETLSLSLPASGESSAVADLPALDNTTITVSGYELGTLVAWGKSPPVTADTGTVDVPIFVATPREMARFGGLTDGVTASAGASLGDGRFLMLGGFGNRSTGGLGDALDLTGLIDLGVPNEDLSFEPGAVTLPAYTDGNGVEHEERGGATLTALTSGPQKGQFLYVGGGATDPGRDGTTITPEVRYFDPEDLSFSEPLPTRDALAVPRSLHAASANTDGAVLVWGGWGVTSSRSQIWNVTTGEFFVAAEEKFTDVYGPDDAGGVGSALADLGDDGTMVCGGIHVDDYDSDTVAEWKLTDACFRVNLRGEDAEELFPGLPKIAAQTLVALPDGDVLSFGGVASTATLEFTDTTPATSAVYRYYHGSHTWTQVGNMLLDRAAATAVLVDETTVVIAGGSESWGPLATADQALSCVEVYDSVANTSEMVGECDEGDENAGLPNRAESPLAMVEPGLGVLFAGGVDGNNGAQDGVAFYLFGR